METWQPCLTSMVKFETMNVVTDVRKGRICARDVVSWL